jgi:hypothetical protein
MSPREEENRRIWAAGEPRRADRRLRVFGARIGHAVMCPQCDGAGVVLGRALAVAQPVKCGTCNGEGLDPHARQGAQ